MTEDQGDDVVRPAEAVEAEAEAMCWVEWAEGIDMLRRTVRVLQADGRIVMQGTALMPAPRVEGERAVIALVPDPNAPELDDQARDFARKVVERLAFLVGKGMTGTRELAFPFTATLQVRL